MTKDVLKYLQPNAVIPIDMETTTALVNALKERLAQETALQALHNENERLGLYKDAYAEQEPLIGCVNHDCDRCKEQQVERNFCPRCGKRTPDSITIHTCTPPREGT